MKEEVKEIVAVFAIMPVIADYLEDLTVANNFKVKRDNLVTQIRKVDKLMFDSADLETIEQQINIQRAFRQWVKENFN